MPAEQQSRKQPRRGEPQPPKPTPRGPPLRKPKQAPAEQLSPDSLKKRRARDAEYSKVARKRKRDAAIDSASTSDDPYKRTKTGRQRPEGRSGKAQSMAKSRRVLKIVRSVKAAGDRAQQVAALRDAADHHELRDVVRAAELVPPSDAEVALFHQEQQRKMLARAKGGMQSKGRLSDDRASFRESNLVAVAPSPNSGKARLQSHASRHGPPAEVPSSRWPQRAS